MNNDRPSFPKSSIAREPIRGQNGGGPPATKRGNFEVFSVPIAVVSTRTDDRSTELSVEVSSSRKSELLSWNRVLLSSEQPDADFSELVSQRSVNVGIQVHDTDILAAITPIGTFFSRLTLQSAGNCFASNLCSTAIAFEISRLIRN